MASSCHRKMVLITIRKRMWLWMWVCWGSEVGEIFNNEVVVVLTIIAAFKLGLDF